MARGGKMSAPERDVRRIIGEIIDMIEEEKAVGEIVNPHVVPHEPEPQPDFKAMRKLCPGHET
jgi:hypothetical protein